MEKDEPRPGLAPGRGFSCLEAPAAGLEPATRRLTGLFRTLPIRRNSHSHAVFSPKATEKLCQIPDFNRRFRHKIDTVSIYLNPLQCPTSSPYSSSRAWKRGWLRRGAGGRERLVKENSVVVIEPVLSPALTLRERLQDLDQHVPPVHFRAGTRLLPVQTPAYNHQVVGRNHNGVIPLGT